MLLDTADTNSPANTEIIQLVPQEDVRIKCIITCEQELSKKKLESTYTEDKWISGHGTRQFHFGYRAGNGYGQRPKPDTHIISCTVEFKELGNAQSNTSKSAQIDHTFQEYELIELSIFPSLVTRNVTTFVLILRLDIHLNLLRLIILL